MYSPANEVTMFVPNLNTVNDRNPTMNTPGILMIRRSPSSPDSPLAASGSREEENEAEFTTCQDELF